jgi:hypothetical protein
LEDATIWPAERSSSERRARVYRSSGSYMGTEERLA